MSRGDIAYNKFKQGYNCAQAVAVTFCDYLDMDEDTVARAVSGFGGGMGRMREVCGTLSGMTFVMSYIYGYSDPKSYEEKAEHYSRIQSLANKFKDENGSIVCRELLSLQKKGSDDPVPEKRTEQYYKKRPCAELVRYVADILEDYINNNPPQK